MSTVIILQARMNSSRLPGKILMDLDGKPVLQRVIERLKKFRYADNLIVATTDSPKDDDTCKLLDILGQKYFRGSESNVLERYYLCATKHAATQIIRATADDPLTDISLLEMMFESHLKKQADYTTTSGFPIGVQEEIVTYDALKRCYEKSTKENHFEHVLEYIQENVSLFNINRIEATGLLNREDVRVTLDTKEDYRIIEEYYKNCHNIEDIDTKKIIEMWDEFYGN